MLFYINIHVFVFCYNTVSCGNLMKQAIADETKQGLAAKAYIDKGMMGKSFPYIVRLCFITFMVKAQCLINQDDCISFVAY